MKSSQKYARDPGGAGLSGHPPPHGSGHRPGCRHSLRTEEMQAGPRRLQVRRPLVVSVREPSCALRVFVGRLLELRVAWESRAAYGFLPSTGMSLPCVEPFQVEDAGARLHFRLAFLGVALGCVGDRCASGS